MPDTPNKAPTEFALIQLLLDLAGVDSRDLVDTRLGEVLLQRGALGGGERRAGRLSVCRIARGEQR